MRPSRFRWVSCQMDYLCECSTDRERRNALRKLPPDLATTCLTYLNYPTFKKLNFPKIVDEEGGYQIQKYLDTYHFLTYATVFWDEHARTIIDDPSVFKKVKRLFRPGQNNAFKVWKRLRFYLIREDNELWFRRSDDYDSD